MREPLAALALILIGDPTAATSQDRGDATSLAEKGEIIVTANRRAEPLRKVPESIAVVTGAQLQQNKIQSLDDLARAVPNVSVSNGGSPGLGNIEIRGVSSQAGASTTGLYVDDVPINILNLYTAGATEPRFFDMDRVEVLRGPQGTLYGSSSMGGTIRFISNQPKFDVFEADLHGEVSGTQGAGTLNYETSGVVNVPLISDAAALRVGVDYRQDAGWIDRISPDTGKIVARSVNRDKIPVVRATLRIQPTDRLTITPAVFAQRYSSPGTSTFNPSLPHFETDVHVPERERDAFILPSLTARYDFGFADLTSITSYFARKFDRQVDGTFYDSVYVGSIVDGLYGHGGDTIGALAAPSAFNTRDRRFTQELRLVSKTGSKLSWIVGFYYTHDREALIDDEYIPGFNTTFQSIYGVSPEDSLLGSAFPNDQVFYARSIFKTNEYAGFGDLTYHLTSRLKLEAGLRYDVAHENLNFMTSGFLSGGPPSSSTPSKSHSATPKFSVSYDLGSTVTTYANVGKGYRLGGANRPVPLDLCANDLAAEGLTQAPQNYKPDQLWSYEAGVKGHTHDQKVSFDAAVYDIQWKRIQEDVILYDCGFDYKANVGNARIRGAEASVNLNLTRQLSLNVAGNYTSAKITSNEPALGILSGDKVIGVPEYTVSVSGQYERPVGRDMDGYVRGNFQLVGRSQGAISHDDPDFRRPSYTVLGGSIGLKTKTVDMSFFATNLLNDAKVIQQPNIADVSYAVRVPPRTVGLSASYHY